jgi:DNA-binding MarR family transcriptional regulator
MTKKFLPLDEEFTIDDFPFYWVALLNSKYSIEMEKKLKTIDLDIIRWRILMLLKKHGEMSISDICIHAVAKIPTITKIMYRMKNDLLVSISTSKKDARVSIVTITDNGLDKINHIVETTNELFSAAFDGFTTKEIERLNKLNKKLLSNLFIYSESKETKKHRNKLISPINL